MNNSMFDVINSIDVVSPKDEVINELSSDCFHLGNKVAINKLINKMINLGLIAEDNNFLSVTPKGKEFYNNATYLNV